MKTLRHELRYDGATVGQVHEMLADPAFREEVCARQHYQRWEVDITREPRMSVRIDQHRPVSARSERSHHPAAGADPGAVVPHRSEQDRDGERAHRGHLIPIRRSSATRPPPKAVRGSSSPAQLRCVGQASG